MSTSLFIDGLIVGLLIGAIAGLFIYRNNRKKFDAKIVEIQDEYAEAINDVRDVYHEALVKTKKNYKESLEKFGISDDKTQG